MTKLRHFKTLAIVALAVMLLAGCSSGSAPEANRGQDQDANRDSVISDMQATRTWDIINGTPDSTPEETPAP